MHIMTERTGLLGMGTCRIGKILPRPLMTGKARLLNIISKIQGKRFMGIGMTGKTVFQLKMGRAFMAHGTLRYDLFTPGRMLAVTIKTGNCGLVFPSVTGDCGRFILVALRTVSHFQCNQFHGLNLLGKNKQYCCRENNSTQFS